MTPIPALTAFLVLVLLAGAFPTGRAPAAGLGPPVGPAPSRVLLAAVEEAGTGPQPEEGTRGGTPLSDPSIRFVVPPSGYAVRRRGGVEAVIVDNRAVTGAA